MFWNPIWLLVTTVCFGMLWAVQTGQSDEDSIRHIVTEAVDRLNHGDATSIRELWHENADYVSVGGKLIRGRRAMEDFFARMSKEGGGTQTATIEQVASSLPTSHSWTALGLLQAHGMPMADRYLQSRDADLRLYRKSRAVGALLQPARWCLETVIGRPRQSACLL